MYRLAAVASHPVQYQAPWFRALAEVFDLTVFFAHRQTDIGQGLAGFGVAFDWDVPLLDGYRHVWLANVAQNPGVHAFGGCDTPGIREELSRGGFDACVVNGWYLKCYVQAIRASQALGVPVITRGDSHLRQPRGRLWSAVKDMPYRWWLGRIDGHLYVGTANREYLEYYGVRADRLFPAPHFVDNDRFAQGAAQARDGEADALRRSWGVEPGDTVFTVVARLIPIKRVGDFIEAVARARRDDRTIRGVVIGSGPESERLGKQAREGGVPVHFTGFVNQSRMPACYAATDCLVVPSASESWGLVVNEAMAAGRPAIVSDAVGCAPDLIDSGSTGWSYPAGDVGALARVLLDARAALAARRASITALVRQRIAAYSVEAAVAGTVRAVEALARGRRGSDTEAADADRR